jgi:hypothetical protein
MFLYWTLEYTPPPPPAHRAITFLSLFSEILLKYSFHIEPDKGKGNCAFVCRCVFVCDIILLNKSRGKWRQSAVDFLLLFIIVWRMEMSSLIIHELPGEVLPVDITFLCCWRCTVFYKLQTLHLSALFCVNYGLQHSQLLAWQLTVIRSMEVNNYTSHGS